MSSDSLSYKVVQWSWQSNKNPWNVFEKKQWTRYPDLEQRLIEEEHKQKQHSHVDLGQYIIDFKQKIQFRRDDSHKQRRVKRDEVYLGPCIKVEAKLHGKEAEGQYIIKHLEHVKAGSGKEITQCCARMFTVDAFLFTAVNDALRHGTHENKIDTLGPFCYLLHAHLRNSQVEGVITVYRGANLAKGAIDRYREAIGTNLRWLSLISTTKSRCLVERLNHSTLFIIEINGESLSHHASDVSSLSFYPYEEEVLLSAGFTFKVTKVELDEKNDKHLVHLSSLFGV
ncbi:unnamed protein product [Didymodactylos carnosus]|uniref:WWE domain-containing protein n=1 Tax=Didymodactylos carnosus TaxID=1234261 RepID=A0A814LRW1_9BILA|nr:unnamed protein product [Didymodactylos carnosus]CAF1069206.1 unnamed protein product [Didymodactylos carnosus]CAF3740803.1 unnamed protein product [Didymodactylos carnosus]CAF3836515.1 unnamed protein product [Didymodactylos carnosus]